MKLIAEPIIVEVESQSSGAGQWDPILKFLVEGTHEVTETDPETGEETTTNVNNFGSGKFFLIAEDVTRNQQAGLTSAAKAAGVKCVTKTLDPVDPGKDAEGNQLPVKRFGRLLAKVDETYEQFEARVAKNKAAGTVEGGSAPEATPEAETAPANETAKQRAARQKAAAAKS